MCNFTLRKKCLYSELFWSAFSRIRTKYELNLNADQSNSEYRHFSRSVRDRNIRRTKTLKEMNNCICSVDFLKSRTVCRNRHSQMFFKIGDLKNFAKFTGKHLYQSLFLIKLQEMKLH